MTDQRLQRIPLNTFAIAFGLVGLADVWSFTTEALTLPSQIADGLWIVAAVAWLWLLVAHAIRGVRSGASLGAQLKHPVQGPIAALVPIVGMLVGAEVSRVAPVVGRVLVIAFIAVAAMFAAWLISMWLGGSLAVDAVDAVHGGYFLPTVAGGFIAATAAAEVGMDSLAIAAFAVGAFFWVVMTTLILARMMFRPTLPDPLVPTLAIFVAPPAVAGTAWFLLDPTPGPIEYALAGMTVVMLLVQAALVPRYRKLRFSLGFWSFTFPFAAVGGYGIQWLMKLQPDGWHLLVIAILAGITTLVVAIAIRSILRYTPLSPRRKSVT